MIDEKDLEQAERVFLPPDRSFDRFLRRRDRKRRNQRITAGVVGIVVFVAAVWIVTSVSSLDRSDSSVVPAGDGTAPAVKAQSAGAIDDEFRGWYRVIGLDIESCGLDRDRVQVIYLNERRRYLAHAGLIWSGRLRYVSGESFPWQTTNGFPGYELRYRLRTDTAVGYKHGLEGCMNRVRLIPID